MPFIRAAMRGAMAGAALMPTSPRAQSAPQQMPSVTVTARAAGPQVPPVSPIVERYGPPQTIESVDQRKIADTVNIVDTEDAIKYLPSVFVRKRNYGDNQPTLATSSPTPARPGSASIISPTLNTSCSTRFRVEHSLQA